MNHVTVVTKTNTFSYKADNVDVFDVLVATPNVRYVIVNGRYYKLVTIFGRLYAIEYR